MARCHVTVKFRENAPRSYTYRVPLDWNVKIKVGDLVVLPPSLYRSENTSAKVLAVMDDYKEPKGITFVEIVGHTPKPVKKRPTPAERAASRAKKSAMDAVISARASYDAHLERTRRDLENGWDLPAAVIERDGYNPRKDRKPIPAGTSWLDELM